MKKFLFYISIFFIFLFQTLIANAEPNKIMSLSYDDSSSLVYINVIDNNQNLNTSNIKFSKLENPNRIYFDIENSVLIGDKQQLVFDKSDIKEIKISQFTTAPDVVRCVVTFAEDFNTSKVKIFSLNGNIYIKTNNLSLKNDYFNIVYADEIMNTPYSSIVANSQAIQKVPINTQLQNISPNVIADIEKAFQNSTLNNSNGKVYDSTVSVDLSSDLKLRTKYFINGCYLKNQGLLVSGIGQISTLKMFYLTNPKRVVIDLPNTFVDKKIRNKEFALSTNGNCKDTAKIGQFEFNKARVVVTSEEAEKYIPIYSADAQSLLFINSDKLNHTDLVGDVSNINKVFVRKIDTKTNELIISFTAPVVHSIVRNDNSLNLYLFNVKSYNELDIIKTLNNTYYKPFTLSLLPQIGVKTSMPIDKNDKVTIEQSVDGKAIKLTIVQGQKEIVQTKPIIDKKTTTKGKVILDPGHGGSDYGAIREGINEKDITLDVSQRVASILKSKGYKVAMTRSDDTYVSLQDRVDFAENETPEIFVSIHVNSAVATEPMGIETHYYHDYSNNLAKVVHTHLMKEIDSKDRGLFKSKFYVINHTTMPAILVEMGFLSNDKERAELITDKRKQKTAKAIAEGIIEYIKSK